MEASVAGTGPSSGGSNQLLGQDSACGGRIEGSLFVYNRPLVSVLSTEGHCEVLLPDTPRILVTVN